MINLIDRKALSRSYFSREHVARHQLDSYNHFLEFNLQKVVDEQRVIETDIATRGRDNKPVWVELGKIRVGKPIVREADGSKSQLYPAEARLRNLTYAAPIQLDMVLVHGDDRQEAVTTTIGQLPVMIGSKACNLYGLSDEERTEAGEDPLDPRGYFIVNGSERVLMTLEDLASNKIMTEYTERYNERIYVAKVFSQFRGYRALVIVERNRKNLLEVSFPSVAGHLKFCDLMRALGLASDAELVEAVSTDEDILTFMLQNLEDSEIDFEKVEKLSTLSVALLDCYTKVYNGTITLDGIEDYLKEPEMSSAAEILSTFPSLESCLAVIPVVTPDVIPVVTPAENPEEDVTDEAVADPVIDPVVELNMKNREIFNTLLEHLLADYSLKSELSTVVDVVRQIVDDEKTDQLGNFEDLDDVKNIFHRSYTVYAGIIYVGKKLAPNQTKDYQKKRAEFVLDNYLLPHLNYLMPVGLKEGNPDYKPAVEGVRLAKAHFLGRMAEACFDLVLNRRRIDDKDHYANKRLKLAGDLMEDLFRISLNRLTRDVKYQLERASMRHRELSISTAVRADVLTERLLHPLATGNWVGGRTGVSQLLDRIDLMAVISHLRRVISPLSRSQPHFEARDLHPTQWGRICPSETPEGPNCGLVKNFAQMVEISKGVEDEMAVTRTLYSLGVEELKRELL